MKIKILIIHLFLFTTILTLSGCGVLWPKKPSPPKIEELSNEQIDKIIEDKITKKLTAAKFDSDVNLKKPKGKMYAIAVDANSVINIVGKLYDLKTWNSFVGGYFLRGPEDLDNTIKFTNEINSYIKTGANLSIGVNAGELADAKAGMSEDESLHITYRTIFSSVNKTGILDEKKKNDFFKTYNTAAIKDPVVINQVVIRELKYQKFKAFKGEIAGSASILSLNGALYSESGDEITILEVFVGFDHLLPPRPNDNTDVVMVEKDFTLPKDAEKLLLEKGLQIQKPLELQKKN